MVEVLGDHVSDAIVDWVFEVLNEGHGWAAYGYRTAASRDPSVMGEGESCITALMEAEAHARSLVRRELCQAIERGS